MLSLMLLPLLWWLGVDRVVSRRRCGWMKRRNGGLGESPGSVFRWFEKIDIEGRRVGKFKGIKESK